MDLNVTAYISNGLIRQNLCGTETGTDTMHKYRSHLSSYIRCSVKAKHKVVQPIFSGPGPGLVPVQPLFELSHRE